MSKKYIFDNIELNPYYATNPLYVYYLKYARANGDISQVPKKFRDYQMYYATIKANGRKIQNVPINHMTYEICYESVKQNIKPNSNLHMIPSYHKDFNLCKCALENGCLLSDVPPSIKNQELIKIAVENNGNNLKYLTKDEKTYDLCLLAVKNIFNNNVNKRSILFELHNILPHINADFANDILFDVYSSNTEFIEFVLQYVSSGVSLKTFYSKILPEELFVRLLLNDRQFYEHILNTYSTKFITEKISLEIESSYYLLK